MITKDLIESLNPCKDRYKNYLKYYGDEALTIAQFMGRKNINQSDKLWVAFRLMSRDNVRLAAANIAESVLHILEARYPNDDRPRKAIAGDVDKAREAANASVDASYFAAVSAYFAYSANAANAAYLTAGKALQDLDKEEKLIRKIILKYWKE